MKHLALPAAGLLFLGSMTIAADDLHDEPRHRPLGSAHEGHGHAHPGIDLTHPIVTESPLPETHLRLDYTFADGEEAREQALTLSGEYAFTPELSLEAVLPYVFVNPEDGQSTDRISDAILGLKWASYRWVDQGFMPAIGVEVILPTGNEERGIGSDHVVEIEPFARLGYWSGPLEFIGTVAVGIPFNQDDEEDAEEDFELAYNLSTVWHAMPDLQVLLELHGESVFGADNEHIFMVSPGITFQPFEDKSITLGVGATVPVTGDREFDYAINLMTIVHF